MEKHHHCPDCVEILSSEAGLLKHIDMLHTPIECQCGLRITMDAMQSHVQIECSRRKVICRFCHLSTVAGPPPEDHKDRLNGLTSHESECGSRTETCPECNKYVRMKEMDAHLAYHQFLKQQNQTQQAAPTPLTGTAPLAVCLPIEPRMCSNNGCGHERGPTSSRALCLKCDAKFTPPPGDARTQAQALVKHYFHQMTKGCGVEGCTSAHCGTTRDTGKAPKEVLAEAVHLAKQSGDTARDVRFYFCNTPEETARRDAVEGLHNMGFPLPWCARGLELKNGDTFNATSWIMEEMPQQ